MRPMKLPKLLTTYLLPLFAVVLFLSLHSSISASSTIVSLADLKLDTEISLDDFSYSVPESIVLVPITPATKELNMPDREWYRGLYYFMIGNANRPGFTDIPFHYVISSDGSIYAGNSGGEERKVSIRGLEENIIVIGYLAKSNDTNFASVAVPAIKTLVLEIANRHGVKPENISVSGIKYTRDDESQTIILEKQEVYGLWQTGLNGIKQYVTENYKPVAKTYNLEITAVELPSETLAYQAEGVGRITITNKGEYGVYAGTVSEIIGSKTSGNSLFYNPSFWSSLAEFRIMAESDILVPGQSQSFEFRLKVPLYWGELSETFQLKTTGGVVLPNTGFTVKITASRPEGTIVEAKPTATGFTRVYIRPDSTTSEVTRISSGERCFVIEEYGLGWIKIRLTDGREGYADKYRFTYL